VNGPSTHDLLACAVEAVQAAGAHARAHEGRRGEALQRTAHDVKLALDHECQHRMEEVIQAAYPRHHILGEEGGGRGDASQPLWILDPIDGTVNFSHGLPYWCHSAAIQVDGRTVAGAVLAPVYGELYTAQADGPALCNGRPLQVSTVDRLGQAMVLTGMEKNFDQHSQSLDVTRGVALQVQKMRLLGAAALDLCQIASGRADLFFESGLHVWDVAAAELIIQRAGGRTEILARLNDVRFRYFASNGALYQPFRDLLAQWPDWFHPET